MTLSCTGEFYSDEIEFDDKEEQQENNQQLPEQDYEQAGVSDLKSFDVAFDDSALQEDETVPSKEADELYEDYVENYSENHSLTVTWSEGSVSLSGATDKVKAVQQGADVVINSTVAGMRYILKGKCSDGMISIYSDYKFRLDIDALSLSNPDGPAINIQSGKRAYVVLSGSSFLSDGPTYSSSDEDRKGTFFSEGQLCFSGSGTLDVTASYKNGIVSDDYLFFRQGPVINVTSSGTNGLKANDWIHIEGGVLNIKSTAVGGKCVSSDGYVRINGGRTTLMTTGGVDVSDYSSSCCIKSDSLFVMNGGELLCKSTGQGGKGIKADMNAYFNGGKVRVITTGADYGSSGDRWGGSSSSNTARPKGIRVEGKLFINGGDIMVRVSSHEGIESKSYIEVNGGRTMVQSYDDAINSAGELIFNGGFVYSQATGNDALDSNGNLTINGGVVFAVGPASGAECAIDVNTEGRAYMAANGGVIVGIGSRASSPSQGTQCYAVYGSLGMGGGPGGGRPGGRPGSGSTTSGTVTAGETYVLTDKDSKAVIAVKSPVNASSLFVSMPGLISGQSYALMTGVTLTGGNEFCGLVTDCEGSGGVQTTSLTANKP